MPDPEQEVVDELEDPDEAELLALSQSQSTFEVQPFDADGNPVWDIS